MALCGLGFGFFQAPNNRAIMASAPRRPSGAAGGMLSAARLLGQALGAAGVAILFSRLWRRRFKLRAVAGGAPRARWRSGQRRAADHTPDGGDDMTDVTPGAPAALAPIKPPSLGERGRQGENGRGRVEQPRSATRVARLHRGLGVA